jgi:hypothetical protein
MTSSVTIIPILKDLWQVAKCSYFVVFFDFLHQDRLLPKLWRGGVLITLARVVEQANFFRIDRNTK